jgi:hypothetical protein
MLSNIGSLDPDALGLQPESPLVTQLERRIRMAGMNPANVPLWVRAGILIIPGPNTAVRAWTQSLNTYITTARPFIAACSGDEQFAALAAAAGFTSKEAANWTDEDRPTAAHLRSVIGLRKLAAT